AGYAKANLSMRTARAQSTAADVYLTVGKGARSAAPGDGLRPDDWAGLQDHDRGLHYGGAMGSVGQALLDGGRRWALAGADDPDAWVVAATADGSPPAIHADLTSDAPAPAVDALFVAVPAAGLPAVLDRLAGTCTLVASASTPSSSRHLGVLAASPACGLGTAGLGSPSTHHAHLATLPDVSRTFLHLVGVATPSSVGGAVVTPAAAIGTDELVERDRRTWTADRSRTPFVWLFVLFHAVGAAVAVGWRRARTAVACVLLAVPAASLLMMAVPWWRGGAVVGLLVGGLVSAVLAAGAMAVARRDPVLAVGSLAALTAAAVGVDALFGSPLQIDAPFGNSPVVAGRFFGVGNIGSGFLAAGLLVAGGLALDRWGRRSVPWVAGAVAAGAIAGGAPMFGADVGGVLFAIPAYGLLLLGAKESPVTARHLLLAGGAALVALALFAAVDLARDAGSQTHLARSVGGHGLGDDIVRKGSRAIQTVKAPMANVVVAAVAALALVRYSPGPRRARRMASYAVVVAAVLGSAVNDSGLNVAAAVLAVAWPVGVVVGARRGAGAEAGVPA
ncbi:MAG TPA: hypothetical protein VF244_09455, partial [Acidimicrobiales bacterium]